MSRSRPAAADMKRLVIDWATTQGCQAECRKGHWRITYQGRLVGTIASTPSDSHSILNAKAFIRRNLARIKDTQAHG
jgi:hypothetical protein